MYGVHTYQSDQEYKVPFRRFVTISTPLKFYDQNGIAFHHVETIGILPTSSVHGFDLFGDITQVRVRTTV